MLSESGGFVIGLFREIRGEAGHLGHFRHTPALMAEGGTSAGTIRILMLGDIFGEPGRRVVADRLAEIKQRLRIDFTIANGENAAGGRGITGKIAISLLRAGVTVITLGDHAWDQPEVVAFMPTEPRLLRPVNYPAGAPGHGWVILDTSKGKVGVLNLQGRIFMPQALENPFNVSRQVVDEMGVETKVILVDFHAEATSEKIAMGRWLDGRVSAVIGTHTHVQTADEMIFPGGTAYLTDVGMCGPIHSVIGSEIDPVLHRFATNLPTKNHVARGDVTVRGVVVEVDPATGRAVAIERLAETVAIPT
jgi:2',3'-cyclic-nucleotide 2'-phosphodiesterase